MGRLMARIDKPDHKWRVSASSFANEHAFCSIAGVGRHRELREAGVWIPEILLAGMGSVERTAHNRPRAD